MANSGFGACNSRGHGIASHKGRLRYASRSGLCVMLLLCLIVRLCASYRLILASSPFPLSLCRVLF
uniref:Uncharacterized protein n=1 Tax=Bionectria ochroleuca TaxID=29856 RepID=A0A0B7JZ76_BIOOC